MLGLSICLPAATTGFSNGFGNHRIIQVFRPSLSIFSSSSNGKNCRNTNVVLSSKTDDLALTNLDSGSPLRQSRRRVAKVEKFARLPVWPVWTGVIIFLVNRIFGDAAAAQLENAVGGRVCPNFFTPAEATSPFIMLVHHRHSFWAWDPIRFIQRRFILAEGFPSHPHRGFTTLTYFLRGGFVHRDSLGIQQTYGRAMNGKSSGDDSLHSQWLFTGAGLLHEEMFDSSQDQELYQLWINVPSRRKMDPPQVELLGNEECPEIGGACCKTVVLAGKFQEVSSKAPIMSDMSILHITVNPGGTWVWNDLPKSFETVIVYVRQGELEIIENESSSETVPPHHTAYFERVGGDALEFFSKNGADVLLLAGEPLFDEKVQAQGSMVMNTPEEINQAYSDYERGFMGRPWDHYLSNEEWKAHVQSFPCRYQYQKAEDKFQ